MASRRQVLTGAIALSTLGTGAARVLARSEAPLPLDPGLPSGLRESAVLDTLAGKVPLIRLTARPPNCETPLEYFRNLITPADAFFVRYHLPDVPDPDAPSWRLRIGGPAARNPLTLTLDDLRRNFPTAEVTAVCLCSGNRRGLFQPHVQGIQWGYGAMGNARWTGVRLKELLAKAGVSAQAVEIAFDGADAPPLPATPDFVKSLPAWKAMDENTIVAYAMNDAPLPRWNGFPLRLVVPGWTATYWVKHLNGIQALDSPLDNFWVRTAYRVPKGKFATVDRFLSQETEVNTPITEIVVNSLITEPATGSRLPAGRPIAVKGIAWDGGAGISAVEVSADGGKRWAGAVMGENPGRFSFRAWSATLTPAGSGPVAIQCRATNTIGQTQTEELIANPAGYNHNLMHRVEIQLS
jgi:DMSO/TMAO reductase YedYZ molybdopterin-dependent catalytic subunit